MIFEHITVLNAVYIWLASKIKCSLSSSTQFYGAVYVQAPYLMATLAKMN